MFLQHIAALFGATVVIATENKAWSLPTKARAKRVWVVAGTELRKETSHVSRKRVEWKTSRPIRKNRNSHFVWSAPNPNHNGY